ncbi:MAG: hypothetical protein R3344_07180 [Acidobacteriota bacterium]|nr:hypothetical protein [Acidobacteriota bacterium]
MRRILSAALLCTLVLLAAVPALAQGKTKLTKKAEAIKTGTSREKAIETLGPATWAVLPADGGPGSIADLPGVALQLQWSNGEKCFPVTLLFDDDMKVQMIDHGAICFDKALDQSVMPPGDYSCEKPDRSSLCKL